MEQKRNNCFRVALFCVALGLIFLFCPGLAHAQEQQSADFGLSALVEHLSANAPEKKGEVVDVEVCIGENAPENTEAQQPKEEEAVQEETSTTTVDETSTPEVPAEQSAEQIQPVTQEDGIVYSRRPEAYQDISIGWPTNLEAQPRTGIITSLYGRILEYMVGRVVVIDLIGELIFHMEVLKKQQKL